MIHINTDNITVTISAVSQEILRDVKTSFNTTSNLTCAGTSSLSMSAARGVGIEIDDIDVPIFSAVEETKYPYELYNAIGVPGDPDLSAFPPPNVTQFGSVFPIDPSTSGFTLEGLSTNECLLYSIVNGFVNTIISAMPDTYVVNSENEQLSLSNIKRGDFVIRSDQNKSYISTGFNGSTINNWQEISSSNNEKVDWSGHVNGLDNVTESVKYVYRDGMVHLWFDIIGTVTDNNVLSLTLPIVSTESMNQTFGGIRVYENVGFLSNLGICLIESSSNIATFYKDGALTSWVLNGITRGVSGYICYQV